MSVGFSKGKTITFVSGDSYREVKHPRMKVVISRKGE